jgi:hypothetical protein
MIYYEVKVYEPFDWSLICLCTKNFKKFKCAHSWLIKNGYTRKKLDIDGYYEYKSENKSARLREIKLNFEE